MVSTFLQDNAIKNEELCRLCLSKEKELCSIFDVYLAEITWNFLIFSTTEIKIEAGDGLPSMMCTECKEKAASAFDFKKKSHETDNFLRNSIKRKELLNINNSACQSPVTKIKSENITENNEYLMSISDFASLVNSPEDTKDFDNVKNESVVQDYSIHSVAVDKEQASLKRKSIKECKEKASSALNFKKKSCDADIIISDIKVKKREIVHKDSSISLYKPTVNVKCEEISTDNNDDYIDFGLSPSVNSSDDVKYNVEFQDAVDAYCPLCDTSYDDANNLTKHMWNKHSELMGPKKRGRPKKLITSTILTKLYESGFCLKSGPLKLHKCLICDEHYKTKEDLGMHMMEHKETKIYCCILCKKMYLNSNKFEGHACIDNARELIKVQDSNSAMQANNKQINFLNEVSLQDLLYPNTELERCDDIQVCAKCDAFFLTEVDLVNHNDAEHPELSLRCNLCTKVFASIKSAAKHRSICKKVERNHTCTTCGLKFAYEISLNKHILRYHEGQSVSVKFMDTKAKMDERKFQCDACNRCFYRKELLVRHTKIHMPNEKYYECDVCKKKFHRSDNLRSHKRIHEVNQGKSASGTCLCLYCGRSFSNSSNLIVHMRRHTGEKPYKCDFCEKGFPRSSDLQCHRRTHTGEKPCKCRVCGKGFSRSNKLSRHMRVHTGHKPYKCTYCEKAFSQSNDLTLHIRRHTGDKPYICEVCGDRFIQGSALQNHRRVHGHFPPSASGTQAVTISYNIENISHVN